MNRRFLLAAVVAIASTLLSPVLAQVAAPPPGASDSNLRDNNVKGRSNEIERVKRDAEKPESSPEQKFPQIKEDFERIQIINSEVLQAGAPIVNAADYERISEAASEITKRAMRLKSNMFSVEPEKRSKEKKQAAEEPSPDLKSLLAALDSALSSFVSNPMFQNIKVVDSQASIKARQDLEEVIKLSTKIGKQADRMKKAGG